MTKAATVCLMTTKLGSNIFYHACLLLSELDPQTKRFRVTKRLGFGGLPENVKTPIISDIKAKIGLNYDLYGNHGIFYDEEIRHFDKGYGLLGMTFEINTNKYNLLKNRCDTIILEQNKAIEKAATDLKLKPLSEKEMKKYPYEHESYRIFQHVLKNTEEGQEPPLKEFSLSFSPNAQTCKKQIIKILEDFLDKEQINQIKGWHSAIPRLSGRTEEIFFHSEGPLHVYECEGKKSYYRKSEESQLYWTIPPQEFDALSHTTQNLFNVNSDHLAIAKDVIRKLHKLERFFRTSSLDEGKRDKILTRINQVYDNFATIENKKSSSTANNSGFANFCFWAMTAARNGDEKVFLEKIEKAKDFLNALYMAVVDNWDKAVINKTQLVEGLPVFLDVHEQKQLCEILGRNYVEELKGESGNPHNHSTHRNRPY